MIRPSLTCVAVTGLIAMGGGCAQPHGQRIALLQEVNRNLTERLNMMGSDLDMLTRDRDALGSQLDQSALDLAAMQANLVALQGDLDARPVAQDAAPGWTPVPGGAMIAIESGVLFAPGKGVIRKDARRTLDAVVSALQGEYAGKDILVIGHTDNIPIKKSGWTDNYQLSTERALAVVRFLKDHGVSAGRLIAAGCGEHRPRVANSSDANRTANRRVEILATTPLPNSEMP
ncbi:MAG: OmpA family protein [Planctomycetes bacterium]|nr:OmpA family protein [Planctomycetota bacterium]